MSAPAWSYSGAGGECGDKAMEKAAASGSAEELTRLVDARVDYRLKQLDAVLAPPRIFGFTLKMPPAPLPTREEMRKLIANNYNGCSGVLLDHAVAGGNIAAIDALLAMGADVNGRRDMGSEMKAVAQDRTVERKPPSLDSQTLLMRCWHIAGPDDAATAYFSVPATDEQRARTRRGYAYILTRGADVRLLSRDGQEALKMCRNADVVKLMLNQVEDRSRAANDPSPLRTSLQRVLEDERLGDPQERDSLQAVDTLLANTGSRLLNPQDEAYLCEQCGDASHAAACAALKRHVQLVDERMFEPQAIPEDVDSPDTRDRRCKRMQEGDALRPHPWVGVQDPKACGFATRYLPKDFVVVAAGGRGGRSLGFLIDGSHDPATQFDVRVHADKPVALMLIAFEPTIWAVSWTTGVRIVAVYAGGDARQVVTGLPPGTPVIQRGERPWEGCSRDRLHADERLDWNRRDDERVVEAFGRSAVSVVRSNGRDGLLDINLSPRPAGPYESAPGLTPESYRGSYTPLAGEAGLKWALDTGLLRLASDAERQLALRRTGHALPASTYTVLRPMTLPAGLGDAAAAQGGAYVFVIPEGVPLPAGDVGQATVVDLNQEVTSRDPMAASRSGKSLRSTR